MYPYSYAGTQHRRLQSPTAYIGESPELKETESADIPQTPTQRPSTYIECRESAGYVGPDQVGDLSPTSQCSLTLVLDNAEDDSAAMEQDDQESERVRKLTRPLGSCYRHILKLTKNRFHNLNSISPPRSVKCVTVSCQTLSIMAIIVAVIIAKFSKVFSSIQIQRL